MSGETVVALAAVFVSGLALGFNFWNSHQERQHRLSERDQDNREWYKRTLFEKRLEALQEAKAWLNRLSEGMYGPNGDDRKVPIGQVLDWYVKNLIYIHGDLPDKSPLGTFLYETDWSMTEGDEWPSEEQFRKANDYVQQTARELLKDVTGGSS